MKKVLNTLKERWGIDSVWRVILILIVFSLAGFTTAYSHNFIDYLLGIDSDTQFYIKAIVFVLLILPVWMLSFFVWGTVLGQRKFVVTFLRTKLRVMSGNKLFRNYE